MTARVRIAFKLAWMLALVGALILLGQVRHDFIYQAF
jgi:hypothetical protein